jgi:hypothetical protein
MIYCKKHDSGCYYSQGILLTNIPFQNYNTIQIQKMTLNNNNKFVYDLYPAFHKFQKAIKTYYKICKSTKWTLNREIEGPNNHPQFHRILQEMR